MDGKRIATPQLGNTQDVALRRCLADLDLGSVEVRRDGTDQTHRESADPRPVPPGAAFTAWSSDTSPWGRESSRAFSLHVILFKNTFGLLVLGLQSLPSICWLPLAILWFGLSEKDILFFSCYGCVPFRRQSGGGNPSGISSGRLEPGCQERQAVSYVILPSAMPTMITGTKLLVLRMEIPHGGGTVRHESGVVAVIQVIVFLNLATYKLGLSLLEKAVLSRWGTRVR